MLEIKKEKSQDPYQDKKKKINELIRSFRCMYRHNKYVYCN